MEPSSYSPTGKPSSFLRAKIANVVFRAERPLRLVESTQAVAGIAGEGATLLKSNNLDDQAFLNVSKFTEVFAAQPDAGPEEIVDEYIAKIPTETFLDSCIFHGLHGCGLSKQQRSVTCNRYLCSSLQTLRKLVDDNASNFLLAATNLRDDRNKNLAVYRIKLARDDSEHMLLHASSDRMDSPDTDP